MAVRKQVIIIILMAFATAPCFAQKKEEANSWQFHSVNNIGLLEGQTGAAFQLQTINGAQYKSWFAGVGVGLDYYRFRTIPLFADIRKEFGNGSNHFFVYADAGIHFGWFTDKEKSSYPITTGKFSNRFYGDAGIGYKIGIGIRHSLLINAGYSFKSLSATVIDYTPVAYDGEPYITKYHYDLNGISLKAGWEF